MALVVSSASHVVFVRGDPSVCSNSRCCALYQASPVFDQFELVPGSFPPGSLESISSTGFPLELGESGIATAEEGNPVRGDHGVGRSISPTATGN